MEQPQSSLLIIHSITKNSRDHQDTTPKRKNTPKADSYFAIKRPINTGRQSKTLVINSNPNAGNFLPAQPPKGQQAETKANSRYETLKRNIDTFFHKTIQIDPYSQSEGELVDSFYRRKLVSIQKLIYPLKQSKIKYSILNHNRNAPDVRHKRNQTAVTLHNDILIAKLDTNKLKWPHDYKKLSDHRVNANTIELEEGKASTNKTMESATAKNIPFKTSLTFRKPQIKKDYFVFGMGERSNATDNKIENYRDMLWKVNFSQGLYVNTPQTALYTFYVGEGNNSNLIKGIMKRRFWWGLGAKGDESVNFLWTQLKVNQIFVQQKQGRREIKEKRIHPQKSSMRSPLQDPHNKIFNTEDYFQWRKHLAKHEKVEKTLSAATYQKRARLLQKKEVTIITDSKTLQMHNHLPSNFYIGNKKALFYNLTQYFKLKDQSAFEMIPLTFHIEKGLDDPAYLQFQDAYQALELKKKTDKNVKNIWIVKPGENTNRGNGITVCYNLDDIKVRLKGKERNSDGKYRTFILQKYIQNPLLYNKRKFDLRHYALVTCLNGRIKGYWYEEGYVRTSSSQFSIKQTRDSLVHLTNDAIQKHTPDYGKYEKANKLSYADLQKYLDIHHKKGNLFQHIIPKMKAFTLEAFKATYSLLDPDRKQHNFELLGLDFMIDEELQPWLIQVNTNPCLELCCPLLHKMIPALVQNTFKITLDAMFPPPQIWPTSRKPFFGEDPLLQNKFELIFDEEVDGKKLEQLYEGQCRMDEGLRRIEEDDEVYENDGDENWEGEEVP